MQKPVYLAAVLCFALAACGNENNDDKTTDTCPAVEGDRHVSSNHSEPDDLPVMLHVVGRECSKTGENTFAVYPMTEEHADAPFAAQSGMMGSGEITIESVKATMPSMGHGTAEPAKIIDDHSFSVAFQMPGDWAIEVVFSSSLTDASQTVVLPVLVK